MEHLNPQPNIPDKCRDCPAFNTCDESNPNPTEFDSITAYLEHVRQQVRIWQDMMTEQVFSQDGVADYTECEHYPNSPTSQDSEDK